ncbi:MAG: site-specific integrase, partial [Acidobacteriaceae bacterium]|nr:site-specific integrase [Acidobacteriaceae bacterium]
MRGYLHFCRAEKGLSVNTLDAYRRDLTAFGCYPDSNPLQKVTLDTLRSYIDHLRASGLSNRTIARHITTLRGFFAFLVEEGEI